MSKVTRKQAETASRMVAKHYGAERDYGPKVLDRRDYGDGADGWIVSWEEGPFEWPYNATMGGLDEEMFHNLYPEFIADAEVARKQATKDPVPMPKGVRAEAINHYSLGLYREGN